jgi:hypothetical protein
MAAAITLVWRHLLVQIALVFATALGTLQLVAQRNQLDGIAWPVGPAHRRIGQVLAGTLVVLGLLGGILLIPATPAPPALLASVLFIGAALALGLSIAGAAVRLRLRRRERHVRLLPGERIEQGPLRAIFRAPRRHRPAAAVCLLPDPTAPGEELTQLSGALAGAGLAVLAFDWRSLRSVDRLTLQGAVSIGLSWVSQRVETDPERIGLVGIGLGGDLALRSASTDPDVACVLAIEPVLDAGRPGPGLEGLRGLSWFAARRRTRRWRRSELVDDLDAVTAIPAIAPREVGILVSGRRSSHDDGFPEVLRVAAGWPLRPGAHAETVGLASEWLGEHLT